MKKHVIRVITEHKGKNRHERRATGTGMVDRERQERKCAANAAARRKLKKHRAHKAKSDKRHGRKS